MKILILTKRQYMGKDLLDDRFGRFWEVPLELARRGHEVQGISLSYRARATGSFCPASGALTWHSLNLLKRGLPALQNYLRYARRFSTDFRPDIVWACSDAFHAIFGRHVSARIGAKCVIDLYDNFESYPATRAPGVLTLFKRALKAANGITCVSSQLADYVRDHYHSRAPALVLWDSRASRSGFLRPWGERNAICSSPNGLARSPTRTCRERRRRSCSRLTRTRCRSTT